jgi:hypothetical protein
MQSQVATLNVIDADSVLPELLRTTTVTVTLAP